MRNLNDNSVEITWTTDEESTTQVTWHTKDSSESSSKLKEALVAQHSEVLVNLKTNSTYYYKVKSADKFNNESTSEERSFGMGKEPGTARIEISMHNMTIEEQPKGTRTVIRGMVVNTGDLPVKIKDLRKTCGRDPREYGRDLRESDFHTSIKDLRKRPAGV